MKLNITILTGHVMEQLRRIPDKIIQCIITSPPYWGLRCYGTHPQIWDDEFSFCATHQWVNATTTTIKGGQLCLRCNAWKGELGLEPTPDLFIKHLVQIFHEAKRILRDDGVLWLNLADTYIGSGQSWGQTHEGLSDLQRSNKGSLHSLDSPPVNAKAPGLKRKDMCGIPWRTALALQADGWYLRNDVIWYKPNAMPESVKSRLSKSHEYIFLLTKSEKYFYDADSIREPHKQASVERARHVWNGNREAGKIAPSYANMSQTKMLHPLGKNKRDVWFISTKGYKGSHFATFPIDIPDICIRAGSKTGDTVFDPFAGSGTTLEAAFLLRRNAIGIELQQSYVNKIIIPRINTLYETEQEMKKLFSYPGGKHPIRNIIVSHFPSADGYKTYVDVFGGSATILLTKEPSRGEVFNDKNELIGNFFRVVKHRPAELAEKARHWTHSRKAFYDLRNSEIPKDELEKAFYFWCLLADSFGARGINFGTSKEGMHSVTHARMYLNLVAERLTDVHIEDVDFSRCINIYDSPDTFFYCDPPYRGTNGGNSNYDMLTDDEWVAMRDQLSNIKGKFLLSSNADEFVVKLFKGYTIKEIDVPVTLPRKKDGQKRKEVLIANYKFSRIPEKTVKQSMKLRFLKDKPAIQTTLSRERERNAIESES